MARARPGLAKAVTQILEDRGVDGKRLSFRQAERLTGLAPATISELAKGNARTPETVRRFAVGVNEEVTKLLLLAGFVPEDDMLDSSKVTETAPSKATAAPSWNDEAEAAALGPEETEWLGRMGKALAMLPPGRERDLWKENLRRDAELIESFVDRIGADAKRGG